MAAGLRRVTRLPRKTVTAWLSAQDVYTLHKPARRHFKRRRVIVGGMLQQWQADLVDMSKVKGVNDGMAFLLTMIDVFSKVAWCVPMKNKSAASLVAALQSTFVNVDYSGLQRGTACPKEEIVFLCQVVVLYTVILISIYNLTTGHGDSNLWTALLSSSLGYLLPNPT